ncbi:MAG: ATP cone domain-containing protein [archaeon]
MTQVIKRGGKRQAFNPSKIRNAIKSAAKEAKLPRAKIQRLIKEVGDSVVDFYKKKRIVKSTVLRRSILRRLERKSKAVASAWRRYERKKKR